MKNGKKYLTIVVILSFVLIAGQALSQSIKLNAIKPTSTSLPLTDEQQGILAVRTVKASVVNIVGVPKAVVPVTGLGSGMVTITAQPTVSISGTGFIIESTGLIVTNNHVVDDTGLDYSVVFADGTEYPAQILGNDKYDDIALIKIDAKNLIPVKLGNSDNLETGQSVFAIGNSLGRYQNTVSKGVISGLSRAIDETNTGSKPTTHNWIQTDAAINLGNSGGPLINLAGEVVGMNTLVDTSGDSLGFALPVNLLKDAVSQLKTFGKVSRPFLGVNFQTIDASVQLSKNLPVKTGALIVSVKPGTPADLSGLKDGDIITGVDNYVLNSQNPLDAVIQKYQSGNQVMLKILRGAEVLEFPLIVGEQK